MPYASAFLGWASGFNVNNLIMGKLNSKSDKSFENIFVSPCQTVRLATLHSNSFPGFCFQLSDAISIVGREDFPDKWPDLITEMVGKFQSGDFHVINGILRTAHSLFKRFDSLLELKILV